MGATLTHDMSVLSLITGASVIVQMAMAALLLASLFSWYYIFRKVFAFKLASRQCDQDRKSTRLNSSH